MTAVTDLERDPAGEAAFVLDGIGAGPLARPARLLVGQAHERAHPGAVLLSDDRSLHDELVEELADGINYAVWGARAGHLSPERAQAVCQHLVEAFAVLTAP